MSTKFRLTKPYNWLIFKIINPNLEEALRKYGRGKMIDIGCGEKPYLDMASKYVDEHIGLDHQDSMHDTSNVNIIGSAYEIPSANNTYDTILCTDVLEHLEKPDYAIREAFRVLKPGGYGIYSVPLFWHLHEEPRDFYRFTKYGLEHLFTNCNFEVIEIIALSGFWVTFGQELSYYLWGFTRKWKGLFKPIIYPVVYIIQWVVYLLNKIDNSKKYTMEYIAVIRKPIQVLAPISGEK